jgi:hypothetical protein
MFYGALNVHRTYETTSYVSYKGSESGRRSYRMKGSIECRAQFLYPMMKMRNYRRCYKFQGVKLIFKERQESTMSMVVEVVEEEGEVE